MYEDFHIFYSQMFLIIIFHNINKLTTVRLFNHQCVFEMLITKLNAEYLK